MRRRLVVGSVVLALVAGGFGLWWLSRPADPRAEVGWVLVGGERGSDAFSEEIRLPWAEAIVSVGKPTEAVGTDDARLRAPEDGSLVQVSLEFGDGLSRPMLRDVGLSVPQIELVAAGTSYPLTGFAESAVLSGDSYVMSEFSRTVAVRGTDPEVSVRITLADESLTLSADGVEAGRFAELDELPRLGDEDRTALDCGEPELPAGVTVPRDETWLRGKCSAGASVRTPFVDGLGWAAEGHEWMVVDLTTDVPFEVVADGVSRRLNEDSRDAVTLSASADGEDRRVVALDDKPWQAGYGRSFAVEVPRGEGAQLTAQVRTVSSRAQTSYREAGAMRYVWRFSLGEPPGTR